MQNDYLPTTPEELCQRGWDDLDVILVTGDSYIDSPYIGTAVIGRVLEQAGYRVGVIAQPDISSAADILRLGEPRLFWGVSGGSDSLVAEAEALTRLPGFKGYIQDVGGPSANMYGFECRKKLKSGACEHKRCLYPKVCPALKPDHSAQISLLRRLRGIAGVKKAFVASGIRYDMVLADTVNGRAYLREIVNEHVSGQLKVAPEHSEDAVLARMGKPGKADLIRFKQLFDALSAEQGKKQYLTYYLIAAYPGCTDAEMRQLKEFAGCELRISSEQVQIFIPLPSTYSALMYYTEMDPFTLQPLLVEKDQLRRERQKAILTEKPGDEPAAPSRQPLHRPSGFAPHAAGPNRLEPKRTGRNR